MRAGVRSLAPDADGQPHISCDGDSNRDLELASWTGSAWEIGMADGEGDVGEATSLAPDAAGQPHISYEGDSNRDLKCAGASCTGADGSPCYTAYGLDPACHTSNSHWQLCDLHDLCKNE